MATSTRTEATPSFQVTLPSGVKGSIVENRLTVKGPRGECSKDFSKIPVFVTLQDSQVDLRAFSGRKRALAVANTAKSLIEGMVRGVTEGHVYRLKVVYAHFPITVRVREGEVLVENFLGERSPRRAVIRGKCKISVEGDDVVVEGVSREDVGQTAANIEASTRIKRKDLRVFLDGVFVYDKA